MSLQLLPPLTNPPPRWLWPLRVPGVVRLAILRGALGLGRWLGPGPLWLLAGLCIGAVPYALADWVGLAVGNLLSSAMLVAVLAAAVAHDSLVKGMAVLGAAFAVHSGITLGLAMGQPGLLGEWLPEGMAYWAKSRHWLQTGDNPEYDPWHWLPVHGVLIVGMVLASYPTLGLVALYHGFHQVDLMNCYVGRLIAHAEYQWLALALGWHPWSVLRGLGFAVLVFEVVSLSLARLTGAKLSSRGRRQNRWLAGLFLLAADAAIKYFFLESVRDQLAATLRPGH